MVKEVHSSGHVHVYTFDDTNWNHLGSDINGEAAAHVIQYFVIGFLGTGSGKSVTPCVKDTPSLLVHMAGHVANPCHIKSDCLKSL